MLPLRKNKLYAAQGRASTNDWAKKVRELFQADQDLSDYYNQKLAGGKWSHMMDQTHIGYTTWQEPRRNNMPAVKEITVPEAASMAVAVEGESTAFDGNATDRGRRSPSTHSTDKRGGSIFSIAAKLRLIFRLRREAEWIKISQSHGTVQTERRIEVAIDWDKAPSGAAKSSITDCRRRRRSRGECQCVQTRRADADDSLDGFVESDGCVSIEAEHYTKKIDASSRQVGQTRRLRPHAFGDDDLSDDRGKRFATDRFTLPGIRMYLFDSGPVEVQAILSPTLEFLPGRKLRYAVSFDDQPPQIVNALPEGRNRDNLPRDWDTSVKDAVRVSKSKHTLDKPGYHTLKFWMVDPAVVLEKIVVDCGGVKPSYLGPPESYCTQRSDGQRRSGTSRKLIERPINSGEGVL